MNYASLNMPLEPNEIFKFRNSVLRDMKRMINRGFKKQWVIQYFKEPLSSLLDMGAVNISQISREIGVTRKTVYLAFGRASDGLKKLSMGFISAVRRALDAKLNYSSGIIDNAKDVLDNTQRKVNSGQSDATAKANSNPPVRSSGLSSESKPSSLDPVDSDLERLFQLSEIISDNKDPLRHLKKKMRSN